MIQFEKDLQSENRELFLEVRKTILSFSQVEETQKPRITTYMSSNGGICHLRTMPHGIDIGFLKGTLLEDKYQLLHGKGKKLRVLSMEKMEGEVLRYYLNQAIKMNL